MSYKDPKIQKQFLIRKYTDRKKLVINHYGGKCVCCGENNIWFLNLDHKNNDGYKLGRERNMVHYCISHNFPDDIQILCYNCNCGKNNPINKNICPHNFY